MVKLSAFADEVGADLDLQIAELRKNGVGNIEIRGVWGKNVMKLTDEEVRAVKARARDAGIGFSAIGSPLGKFPIDGDLQEQLDGTRRAVEIAQLVGAPYIRVFSFYPPEGGDITAFEDKVMDWLNAMVEVAKGSGVQLAHENEARIFGEKADNALKVHQRVPGLAGVFDPANYAVAGEDCWECWKTVGKHITYFHIKDFSRGRKSVVPAGEGDGKLAQVLKAAFDRGFDNFLTLEPHLSHAGAMYGRTSPELFATAVKALKGILAGIGQTA
jgi:sugar phosphate isomerase/epimerase